MFTANIVIGISRVVQTIDGLVTVVEDLVFL